MTGYIRKASHAALAAAAILIISAGAASSGQDDLRIGGEGSFWWILREEVENGLYQNGSMDRAADVASGFNFRAGRLAVAWESDDHRTGITVRLRLEDRIDLLDFYGRWACRPWLRLYVGQMRIPSTREGLASPFETDFIGKSTFARYVSDYSLSRIPYISSVMAVRSYDRDTGISLKGGLESGGREVLTWSLMVSNGIGAGSYIGGREDEGFIYTNRAGDHYYGGRIEASPVSGMVLGLHASRNRHEDVSLGDRGPVIDFDRRVLTLDLQAETPWGQRIYSFYGDGDMDDYSLAEDYVFEYTGWGLSMIQPFFGGMFELCARFDRFETRYETGGTVSCQDNLTAGLNYLPDKRIRVMLNYLVKDTDRSSQPDLADDILYLDMRFAFDSATGH